MKVALKHLTYINDLDLLKIILSSADVFPGLYRFASTWRLELERQNYMNLLSFLEACHCAEQGQQWKKSQWLSAHERIFNLAFGEKSRDSVRTDRETGDLLKKKAQAWITNPKSFSLAVIDINQPVEEILIDTSYFLMGSLIRFNKNSVEISYDHLNNVSHTTLQVNFQQAKEYINAVFGQKSLSELFLKAEIIGQLDFNEDELGVLRFDKNNLNHLLINFSGNAPVFASVNYGSILPIRFAKLIGVTNVCR